MNTLLCPQKSPLDLVKSTPWKPNFPTISLSINVPNPKNTPPQWKLQARAKGFTSRPPATIKETTINKTSTTNNNNKDDEQIPEAVFERIMLRILVSVGVPMALGIASLHFFGVVKEQHIWDVPMWIPFVTLFVTFGASAFGIAYGALSASLDQDKKGSFLGVEEFQYNWIEMWKEENGSTD